MGIIKGLKIFIIKVIGYSDGKRNGSSSGGSSFLLGYAFGGM